MNNFIYTFKKMFTPRNILLIGTFYIIVGIVLNTNYIILLGWLLISLMSGHLIAKKYIAYKNRRLNK